MRAIILAAGQGKRLLPHTAERPKCLLPFGGRPILEWQLRALAEAGVRSASVVTGFGAEQVEAVAASLQASLGMAVGTRFNPFFGVADNLGSCFVARDLLSGPCLLINGDTLFEAAVPRRVLAAAAAPVAVSVDRKPGYDADDMKVSLQGAVPGGTVQGLPVRAIGKTLLPGETDAESIGLIRFEAEGAEAFADAIESTLRRPDGLRRWYLSVVDGLAGRGIVRANSVEGLEWSEVDFPDDLARAEALAARWGGRVPA